MVPDNLEDLIPLVKAGVRGFKGFLIESGVDNFPAITKQYINRAFEKLQGYKTILMFHAELQVNDNHIIVNPQKIGMDLIKTISYGPNLTELQIRALQSSTVLSSVEPQTGKVSQIVNHNYKVISPLGKAIEENNDLSNIDPTQYSSFLASRPDHFEYNAISLIIRCLHDASIRLKNIPPVHIVHLSSEQSIPLIREARKKGLSITAETCFHYLILAAENILPKSTQFKCCPPIRTEENRLALWDALYEGLITSVVSDHSPCLSELKDPLRGDFFEAWGGITSLGFGLPLLYSKGPSKESNELLIKIAEWCCENTAKQVGLDDCKGSLKVGYDADFLVFDEFKEYIIKDQNTYFKNKLTPYNGYKLSGCVLKTVLRGNIIFDITYGHSNIPMGKMLLKTQDL